MKKFLQIATTIGHLVEEKNAAYGSSFADAGKFLALLYPNGIKAEQYDDALLLVRIFDKQKRIATDRDALGESPYRDIAGYGVLGAALTDSKRKEAACGSANAGDAPTRSKDETDSARRSAAKTSPRPSKQQTGQRSTTARSAAGTAASDSRKQR